MIKPIKSALLLIFILLIAADLHAAQDKPQGMPPAQVVVSEVRSGMMAPESEFIGTVYYHEVSDVAAEVEGLVEAVHFEEGKRVEKGAVLVKLGDDILKKDIQATQASYEQALSDLESSKIEFTRTENLFKENLVTERRFDEDRFRVKGLEKKASSLKAEVERLETFLQKKEIRSPFNGVVTKKHIERGEWLTPGSPVATVASDSAIDIIADVPEHVIRHLRHGTEVRISAGDKQITGSITALVPKGDISTRTFPVRVRVKNSGTLIEGMEARVIMPVGEKDKTLIVPRDAVITAFGNTVVYAVIDSAAKMFPVKVAGYQGMTVGIKAEGLKEGMKVVVKGNERLRDGQAVAIQQ
ncbi:MAG: efflux RND transporter periplasmic adaptor subunit [Nitrospirae bacterium]|nr:efflux RND transporter periplasmic adaptor subunit [Nitrospirota bacterium]